MDIYKTHTISSLLSGNPYPGRGILVGMTEDGTKAAVAYFIMGRSENSRNRIFAFHENGVRTLPFDPSKVKDPSLIIYYPVRELPGTLIVTNGDQTDTIRDFILAGSTFEAALDTRTFEPDAPNYTPRISGDLHVEDGKYSYKLSILKSADGRPACTERQLFVYDTPFAGEGHFIHTYQGDGNPLPSFEGEPTRVDIAGNIDEFTDLVWTNLNSDNKVSLFVRFIDIATGRYETRIVNKNK